MNDTSPEIEALLKLRYSAMSGSERALIALQMFETAQQIVLSSLEPGLRERERRRVHVRQWGFRHPALIVTIVPTRPCRRHRVSFRQACMN